MADALGGLTTYEYDGFDRLLKTRYPIAGTRTSSSTTDYEGFTYDAGSRVTVDRRRDGQTFNITYDNLGRVTLLDAPSGQNDVTTTYDNLSRATSTYYTGHTLTLGYDALGRATSVAGPLGTVSYTYDLAGRRTQMTWPGGSFYVTYDYDATGAMTAIRESGATSGVGVLATYAYDNLGQRTTLTRGNGVVTTYSFDDLSELTSLAQNLSGTGDDQTYSLTYNAAGEALTRGGSNSGFTPPTPYTVNRGYTSNGLNQQTASGSLSLTYTDGRGNLTGDSVNTYGYDGLNRLTSMTGGVTLAYDPVGRLYETAGGSTTRFAYDGADLIAEYNTSGTVLRRYVHGPGADEPLVWYEGSSNTDRRWLVTDQLGSVVATANDSGVKTATNKYDEYGVPDSGNTGRFQYTGQTWTPEVGLYNYKARFYSPTLGRFVQPDPLGYQDGTNVYAYVANDPVNSSDPTGTASDCGGPVSCPAITCDQSGCTSGDITFDESNCPAGWTCLSVFVTRGTPGTPSGGGAGGGGPGSGGGDGGFEQGRRLGRCEVLTEIANSLPIPGVSDARAGNQQALLWDLRQAQGNVAGWTPITKILGVYDLANGLAIVADGAFSLTGGVGKQLTEKILSSPAFGTKVGGAQVIVTLDAALALAFNERKVAAIKARLAAMKACSGL